MKERSKPPSRTEAVADGTLILLAEDSQANQKLILRQLGALGYAADTASDGEEALRMWRETRYGLILTDCNMPKVDGYQLTTEIRLQEGNQSRRTPIVALSGSALDGDEQRCLESGMDAYISKPIRLNELGEAIAMWLDDVPSAAAELDPVPVAASEEAVRSRDPLDFNYLREQFGELEQAFVLDIISTVEASLEPALQTLANAIGSQDREALTKTARKAASETAAAGAKGLSDALEQLASAAGDRDWDAVTTVMDLVHKEAAWLKAFDPQQCAASGS